MTRTHELLSPKDVPMPDTDQNPSAAELRFRTLSRWDNEGGSVAAAPDPHPTIAALTSAELIQLRIRTIALENMLIAVLAEGSDRQLAVAREMAEYIAPRPRFTHHPLTIEAGRHMTSLVDRAEVDRTIQP
jgi:hypothetical protein